MGASVKLIFITSTMTAGLAFGNAHNEIPPRDHVVVTNGARAQQIAEEMVERETLISGLAGIIPENMGPKIARVGNLDPIAIERINIQQPIVGNEARRFCNLMLREQSDEQRDRTDDRNELQSRGCSSVVRIESFEVPSGDEHLLTFRYSDGANFRIGYRETDTFESIGVPVEDVFGGLARLTGFGNPESQDLWSGPRNASSVWFGISQHRTEPLRIGAVGLDMDEPVSIGFSGRFVFPFGSSN